MSFLLETVQMPASYLPAPKAGGRRATAGIGPRAVCQTLGRMKVHKGKDKSNFASPVTENCQTLKRMKVYKDIKKVKSLGIIALNICPFWAINYLVCR